MKTFISTTTLALVASMATAGPFDGNYYDRENGPSAYYCDPIPEGGAVEVKDNEIFFYETSCQLSNPVNIRGMDAILYDATCSGEGSFFEQRIMLTRLLDGDGIVVLTESYLYDWVSCGSK